MYRRIVANKVREAWRHVEARDAAFVLDGLAPSFEYRFVGDHALSGVRTTRPAMEVFFARLFRLFPDAHFSVEDVLVRGWPWATRAVALVRVDAPGGYRNEVAQTIDLRWGRITAVTTLEDTQKLSDALDALAARGVNEAAAAPITDAAVPVVGATATA